MTYTIQALAGVAVALSAVLGVLWRRIRKKLLELLNVDENAGKEKEGNVHRLDSRGNRIGIAEEEVTGVDKPQRASMGKHAAQEERARALTPKWPLRLALALVASTFLAFTVFVAAPYEIVAGASADLVFGLGDIWWPIALLGVGIAVGLALLLSAPRGKAFDIALAILVALGLCAFVQAMLLNGSLPVADGSKVVWGNYQFENILSAAVWIVVIAALITFACLRGALFRGVATTLCACLIAVQGISLGMTLASEQAEAATAQASLQAEEEKLAAQVATGPATNADGSPVLSVLPSKLNVTEEGLFDVSSKNNTIVFVLDFFDTQVMQEVIQSYPTRLDEMTGFTYYPNATGSMIPTRYGLGYLLTADLPQDNESFQHYYDTRYSRSTFLSDIYRSGYSIGIYSDSIANPEIIATKTVNVHPLGQSPLNQVDAPAATADKQAEPADASTDTSSAHEHGTSHEQDSRADALNISGTLSVLCKCALYRDMPWLLKPPFWFYTDEVNNAMTLKKEKGATDSDKTNKGSGNAPASRNDAAPAKTGGDAGSNAATSTSDNGSASGDASVRNDATAGASPDAGDSTAAAASNAMQGQDFGDKIYLMNDVSYYQTLLSDGLSVKDYEGTTGSFRFIHLMGAHYPFLMDENGQDVGEWNSTIERQAAGSLTIVSEYLRQLKELGLYDSATIIITADHGNWYLTEDPLAEATSPLTMVKPAGADSTQPCQTSLLPASSMDIPATVIESVGGDPLRYGSTLGQIADQNRTRYYYMTTSDGSKDIKIKEYRITGDALDFNNWQLTGKTWNVLEDTPAYYE